jgi:Fur family peroxide stress response transcriptional regulator
MLECAGKSYRMTRQRQAILDALRRPHAVSDPAWVLEQVRGEIPNISLGTVSRTMSLLRQAGLISEPRAVLRATPGDSHAGVSCHATCTRCGSTLDARIVARDDLEGLAAAATGFRIASHRFELYGLCPQCSQEEKDNRGARPGSAR